MTESAEIERQSEVLARTSTAARLARALSRAGIARDRIRGEDLADFYPELRRIQTAPRMAQVGELLPEEVPHAETGRHPVWGVIVETRAHPALEYVVHNVATTLDIPIQIFHGPDTAAFIRSTSLGRWVDEGRVVLTPLRAAHLNASQYNALLLSLRFWEQVRASDKVFVFQTDGLVCPRSPYGIDDFLPFAYVGSSWARRRPIGLVADGGSGGVTLRDKPLVMECLRRFPPDVWPGGEDGYYAFHLDLMGARIGRGEVCERFSTQDSFRTRSLCCHQPSRLGPRDLDRFLEYCPEARHILKPIEDAGTKPPEPRNARSYEEMFPPVPVELLRRHHRENSSAVEALREEYLGLAEPQAPALPQRRAVCVSLFCADRMNTEPGATKLEPEARARWSKKYGVHFRQNLKRFGSLFDERWKLVVYACPTSLEQLKPDLDLIAELRRLPFVELRTMKHATVGHGPGALWRFLALADASLEQALVFDIDEPWDGPANAWHRDAAAFARPLTRGVLLPRPGFWLKPESPWGGPGGRSYYPPILGSKILAFPEALGLPDVATLIAAYVHLRMRQSRSSNPVSQLDVREPVTRYNRPTRQFPMGFGSHWYQYCFDERFLKHVVFPYAVRRGLLTTYCIPQDETSDLGAWLQQPGLADFRADFVYTQQQADNLIVNGGRVVRERLS